MGAVAQQTACMGNKPTYDYAREKLWQAVDALATSDRSIQERLASVGEKQPTVVQ